MSNILFLNIYKKNQFMCFFLKVLHFITKIFLIPCIEYTLFYKVNNFLFHLNLYIYMKFICF
jgi:hypothetical protein